MTDRCGRRHEQLPAALTQHLLGHGEVELLLRREAVGQRALLLTGTVAKKQQLRSSRPTADSWGGFAQNVHANRRCAGELAPVETTGCGCPAMANGGACLRALPAPWFSWGRVQVQAAVGGGSVQQVAGWRRRSHGRQQADGGTGEDWVMVRPGSGRRVAG